jgi:hypothetical protein
MEPKMSVEARVSPVPPGKLLGSDVPGSDVEVWAPPFERWMRIVDELLARDASPLPKVIPVKSKLLKH